MAIDQLLKKRAVPFELFDVDIFSATDEQLKELSTKLGLNLSIDEMKRVREYFHKRGSISHRRRDAVHRPGVERALLLQEFEGVPPGAHLQYQAPGHPLQGGRRGHGVR